MTKSPDLITTDRPYVTLYYAIYKKGSHQIWVSVSLFFLSFFYGTLHMWARIDEEQNYKEKMFPFKHDKNNETLSNDWPTYCHTGIYLLLKFTFPKDCIY